MTDAHDHSAPSAQPLRPKPENGIELAPGIRVGSDALRLQFSRSGGPGGQNVNKLNTKAELWLRLDLLIDLTPAAMGRLRSSAGRRVTKTGELHLTSEAERTAEGNRTAVMDRLRQMLITALVEPKRRRKTKPSRSSKLRRLQAKKHRSDIKSGRRSQQE